MLLKTKMVKIIKIEHDVTGQRAREMRTKAGLTLREVARRMQISAPYLCDLELARRNWSVDLAARFEKAVDQR